VSSPAETSVFALADRAREAATRADAGVWTLQARAWGQPSSGDDGVLVPFHQIAVHLRSAADALDPPNLSTYLSANHVRSAVISTTAVLVGVIVLGLTLSGLTLTVVVAAYVMLATGLRTVYLRWVVRQGPRGIEGVESDLAVTAAELTTEVTALLDALRPEHSPRRAKAQVPLQTAAEWTRLAI
jgi:hypothetical protein